MTPHFHGIHPAEMQGVPGVGAGVRLPGRAAAYDFDAIPFGLHHVGPLAEHIAQGDVGHVHRLSAQWSQFNECVDFERARGGH